MMPPQKQDRLFDYFLVFVGGGIGSCLRYSLALLFPPATAGFPLATLLSNVLASALIGFVSQRLSGSAYVWLAVGVCGGWSTFSSFSLESVRLMQEGRITVALLSIGANLALCFGCLWLGMMAAKNI